MKTLILGIGNPILSDDSVGLRVVQEMRNRIDDASIDFAEASASGMDILNLIVGYGRLVIIDSVKQPDKETGKLRNQGYQPCAEPG